MLNILHCIYDHTGNPWVGGGGAVRVYELSRRLALKGHRVSVLSGNYPGAVDYREGNLSFQFAGKPWNYVISTFSYAYMASSFIRRKASEYDLIIEDFAPWNPLFSCSIHGTPSVLHVNHLEKYTLLKRYPIIGIPFFLIERIYPGRFRHITALSEATKQKLGIPRSVVLPAGINSGIIQSDGGTLDPSLVFIGRLHCTNKGLDTLFDALRHLDDFRITIVGRGPDESKLKKASETFRKGKFFFTGFVGEEEKFEILRKSGIFILPSRFEGWGIVLLEAAAFGKPVIVSDIPELRYAVDAGFGIAFRTGDARDLAKKLNSLASDESLRKQMSSHAIRFAREYTWDRIADQYEAYLLKTAGEFHRNE